MSHLQVRWLSTEVALAITILIFGLLTLLPAPTYAACDSSFYVTGDLVGNGNPADVYAAMCSEASEAPIAAESTSGPEFVGSEARPFDE